jgi:starch synthase (maltosyl-transferring)
MTDAEGRARSEAAGRSAQADGRARAVIENIAPSVDDGRFPIKRTVGEVVVVEADVFADGHDAVRCMLCFRREDDSDWHEVEMRPVGNDRWSGQFQVEELGRYRYMVVAWVDRFQTWRRELARRKDPEDILVALKVGAQILDEAAHLAAAEDAANLRSAAERLRSCKEAESGRDLALEADLDVLASRYPDRRFERRCDREFSVVADSTLARFGAWYELFPRSVAPTAGHHGTIRDLIAHLPYVASMGFDVLYLPPIHPIGRVRRKGPNNELIAGPDDPGSPWAIGAREGGHDAIHPELGTVEDFAELATTARELGIALALDIAFQCAPDHPYVAERPQWFRARPDGSVQYAENPPKKYEDIYPFDFESDDWDSLHRELTKVVMDWADRGVRVFRVDNPHTKAFSLWERLIEEVKSSYPEAIFLAEAFTRPKVMHRLAKLGFTQSYTYFAWRNTKWELTQYLEELTGHSSREYLRPNLWPNTPDILTEYLQFGGRAAFMTRLLLAATLGANYGIYGPAYELMESEPREPGSEEYLDSEKYQIRRWDLERPDSLRPFITSINRIRRENPALHGDWSLRFLDIDNEQLIAYCKSTPDLSNVIVVVANLDPHNAHEGWLTLPLDDLGLDAETAYRMQDLLGGGNFLWRGARNFVRLDPEGAAAHVFRLRRRVRTERDFDYFM